MDRYKSGPTFDDRVLPKPSHAFDFLNQKPPAPPPHKLSRGGIISLIIGIPFALFAVMVIYNVANPDTTPLTDRMKRECEREFGYLGPDAVSECHLKTMVRWSVERHQEKLNSAYQRSR